MSALPNPWPQISARLKECTGSDEHGVWLEPLAGRLEKGALTISCPNQFHLNWIRVNYLAAIKEAAADSGLAGAAIRLEIAQPAPAAPAPARARQMELPRLASFAPVLNERYSFANFITGGGNEFACAAAKALAGGQQIYSNTLFMYSSTGLGKSHLAQAMGRQVISANPAARVAYLTAEDFANQMISSIRKKRMETFKDRFRRGCDVLLLEEVQFLAGKEKTQDELGYTLDALLDAGKRIVFTGSVQPNQLRGLKGHLQSRITAGVSVPIDPPDHATRVRILEHLAQAEGAAVATEVLEYLADQITTDVRRLQAALVGLLARASLTGRPLNLSLAGQVVGRLQESLRLVSLSQILELVARVYGLEAAAITGKSRRRAVTRPRNLGMYLCRRHTEASYAAIGKTFGRDHTTVMYGVGQVDKHLQKDPKLSQELAYLEQRLGVEASR